MDKVILNMEIDTKAKELYIGEDNSSGSKYSYTNLDSLIDSIRIYIENRLGHRF